MFFDNSNQAFKIIGVFYVERRPAITKEFETNRNHISIAYRIEGESRFICAEKLQVAPTDSVTYIPTNIKFERQGEAEKLLVIHLQGFKNTDNNIEIIENAEIVKPLFRKLLFVWETKDVKAYNQSVQILYSIFEALQNITHKQKSPIPDIIKPGVELLQTRYNEPSLRISDLSTACFISEVYFRKIYQRFFGESPQQTLKTLRFSRACEMLCSGYYSQKEASRLAGFSDVKYFRTAFKKRFGITPNEYIKKNT